MSNIPINLAECAASATMIASVSSFERGGDAWTELSLWHRVDEERPFLAVVEGKFSDGRMPRFRCVATGTLDRALDWFDPTNLRTDLAAAIPHDAWSRFPDGNTIRMKAAAERRAARGYDGDIGLTPALAWLYPDLAGGSDNALAAQFDRDFGMGARTVRNILAVERKGEGGAPPWVAPFCAALRFFDRKAWEMSRG